MCTIHTVLVICHIYSVLLLCGEKWNTNCVHTWRKMRYVNDMTLGFHTLPFWFSRSRYWLVQVTDSRLLPIKTCSGVHLYHGESTAVVFPPIAMGSQLKSPPCCNKKWTTICSWPPCCQGTAGRQWHTGGWKFDQLEHDHDKYGTRGGRRARVGVYPSWLVSDQPPHPLDQKFPFSAAYHIRLNTCWPPQITSENVS